MRKYFDWIVKQVAETKLYKHVKNFFDTFSTFLKTMQKV